MGLGVELPLKLQDEERDALSLSHLTYRFAAQVTVNFHRLDHPPFPCRGSLRERDEMVKIGRTTGDTC